MTYLIILLLVVIVVLLMILIEQEQPDAFKGLYTMLTALSLLILLGGAICGLVLLYFVTDGFTVLAVIGGGFLALLLANLLDDHLHLRRHRRRRRETGLKFADYTGPALTKRPEQE